MANFWPGGEKLDGKWETFGQVEKNWTENRKKANFWPGGEKLDGKWQTFGQVAKNWTENGKKEVNLDELAKK